MYYIPATIKKIKTYIHTYIYQSASKVTIQLKLYSTQLALTLLTDKITKALY